MPYQKRYRTIVPILRDVVEDQGVDVARWLARETFEKTAAADGLEIVEYSERDVDADEIPPNARLLLGSALTDYQWFEFTGLARLNQVLFDWCAAECLYNYEAWLSAERAWRATQVDA